MYLLIRYTKSVSCVRFPGKNGVRPYAYTKSYLTFEIQKCGQILCPTFLMQGHTYG